MQPFSHLVEDAVAPAEQAAGALCEPIGGQRQKTKLGFELGKTAAPFPGGSTCSRAPE